MNRLALVVLLFLPMIHGCASAPPPEPMVAPVVVAEAARIACPRAADADVREARVVVTRPRPDMTDGGGRAWVSDLAMKAAVDDRDVAIARKNLVIKRLVGQIEACGGPSPAPPA